MHGLETDRISVARFEDGSFRVFVSEGDTLKVEEDRSIMYWQPAVLQTILLKLQVPESQWDWTLNSSSFDEQPVITRG
jgi:hypothetical protein